MSAGRDILVVGLNHRTAPVELRERLAFRAEELQPALVELAAVDGVREGAIISTCNRVELVTCVTAADADVTRGVVQFLARVRRVGSEELAPYLYLHSGREGVRHLFRVAASLDSMVVGEPQILGQMKDHYAEAAAAGTSGAILHRTFHRAFSVAKKIRTETGIASKAVSVASVAADLTSTIFETIEDKTAMLIGAGKMSELVARHLKGRGMGEIVVTTRTFDHAVELAREFEGIPVPFDRMTEYLKHSDVVIGSAGAVGFLITPETVHEVLRARRQRPMFFIDMAVPRNFDPAINEIDNVYLYDIDDLARTTADNADEREREAMRAEVMVESEVDTFWRWLASLEVVPTIVAIREKVECIRKTELEKALASLQDQAPRYRQLLESLTSSIVNKILHAPLSSLRRKGGDEEEVDLVASARQLFDIELAPTPAENGDAVAEGGVDQPRRQGGRQ